MAAGTPATTLSRRDRARGFFFGSKKRGVATIIGGLVALELLTADPGQPGVVVEGGNQIGNALGDVGGAILNIPIRGLGGTVENTFKNVSDESGEVARDTVGNLGSGEWKYPTLTPDSQDGPARSGTPVASESDSSSGSASGKTFTPEETIALFDITDSNGDPIGPEGLKMCPTGEKNEDPEGTCYTAENVDITIPRGDHPDMVDGYREDKTYSDDGSEGDVIGLDFATLRPGLAQERR